MEKRLNGQKALVTGANSGIGAAIAQRLAAEGAEVVINFLFNDSATDELVKKIEAGGGKAMGIKADVSNEEQVDAMFKQMFKAYGTIDILVNNAGIEIHNLLENMTKAEWDKVIAVNLTGNFLCSRSAIRQFLQNENRPSKARGKIVNISSVHQVIMWAGFSSYCATKAGINLFAQSVAQEYAEKKIRINSVAPGAIKTPINQNVWSDPKGMADLMTKMPYGRMGEVEDVAAAVAFLSSDEADYITGTTLYVDGGMCLYPEFRFGG
ncbi:MAG: glucose 1-dehydrogenase [Bacteroidetes bacterium]|nr:glucose 1-dehydrogenase [Bacteroidota bacterium]